MCSKKVNLEKLQVRLQPKTKQRLVLMSAFKGVSVAEILEELLQKDEFASKVLELQEIADKHIFKK